MGFMKRHSLLVLVVMIHGVHSKWQPHRASFIPERSPYPFTRHPGPKHDWKHPPIFGLFGDLLSSLYYMKDPSIEKREDEFAQLSLESIQPHRHFTRKERENYVWPNRYEKCGDVRNFNECFDQRLCVWSTMTATCMESAKKHAAN